MKTRTLSYRLLTVVTLLALILPLSPSPSLLAQREPPTLSSTSSTTIRPGAAASRISPASEAPSPNAADSTLVVLSKPQESASSSTISGRVTDDNSDPVSGVTIQATKMSETPIVFVHGFRGFPPKILGCSEADKTRLTDDTLGNDYFEQVDGLLSVHYPVYYAHLVSNSCYTPPLETNAQHLRDSIQRAKTETGAEKVILIAHSMGGLVSRAYIEGPLYQDDVEALFTFGSPHLGVTVGLIVFLANGLSLGRFCEDKAPAACEFSVTGMIGFNWDHPVRRNGVSYFVIGGDAPSYTRNPLGLATGALVPGPDDGIIATLSSCTKITSHL